MSDDVSSNSLSISPADEVSVRQPVNQEALRKRESADAASQGLLKADSSFKFAVIGDTHGRPELVLPHIEAINLLNPDLVLHVGDLTGGGDPSEWEVSDKIMDRCEVPVFTVPGNHDIYTPPTRAIYEERYGSTYFSLDHKGVHFVGLDSETQDQAGNPLRCIQGPQLQWLENDLASSEKARARFVFLHQPLWSNLTPTRLAEREQWMAKVHPLLAKYKVSAVFAGHVHRYMKFAPLEGVAYYISGAGKETIAEYLDQGDFVHFCLVTVRDDRWQVAVVRPETIQPDTVVYYRNHDSYIMLYNMKAEIIQSESETKALTVGVQVENIMEEAIEVTVQAQADANSSWKITPSRQLAILQAGEKSEIRFQAQIDHPDQQYPGPQCDVAITGPEDKPLQVRLCVPVDLLRQAHCCKTDKPPVVDGKLDDPLWRECPVLQPFLSHTGQQRARHETEVRLAYDAENLYLTFRCYEPNLPGLIGEVRQEQGPVWFDDSVEIFLDPQLEPFMYYHLVLNAEGVMYSGQGKRGQKWVPQCEVNTGREAQAWTLEIALAWESLKISHPGPETKMGLELVRNRAQHPAEWTQWSPTFAGNHFPQRFGSLILQ